MEGQSTDIPKGTMLASRYRVVRKLGQGGMGAVYEVEHKNTHRRLAVKVMLHPDASSRERFLREARAACAVTHPAIVAVHDILVSEGRVLMVMDLLQGQSLLETVSARNPPILNVQEVASYLLPIVSAVGALHASGFVHRDLKPENVFIAENKSFLIDFGIAKDLQAAPRLTQAAVGTPLYMSPEQSSEKLGIVDHRTDIWSLGIVLYECFAGAAPTDTGSTSLFDIYSLIAKAEFADVRSKNPHVPGPIAALIHQMLQREPQRRPQDLGHVYDVLAAFTNPYLLAFYPRPVLPNSVPRRMLESSEEPDPRVSTPAIRGATPPYGPGQTALGVMSHPGMSHTTTGSPTTTTGNGQTPNNGSRAGLVVALAVLGSAAAFGAYWQFGRTSAASTTIAAAPTSAEASATATAPPVTASATVTTEAPTDTPVPSSSLSTAASEVSSSSAPRVAVPPNKTPGRPLPKASAPSAVRMPFKPQ